MSHLADSSSVSVLDLGPRTDWQADGPCDRGTRRQAQCTNPHQDIPGGVRQIDQTVDEVAADDDKDKSRDSGPYVIDVLVVGDILHHPYHEHGDDDEYDDSPKGADASERLGYDVPPSAPRPGGVGLPGRRLVAGHGDGHQKGGGGDDNQDPGKEAKLDVVHSALLSSRGLSTRNLSGHCSVLHKKWLRAQRTLH